MKGTHSAGNHTGKGKSGAGKIVAIVACIVVVIALAGIATFLFLTGSASQSDSAASSASSSSTASASLGASQPAAPASDPSITEAIETLDPHAGAAPGQVPQGAYVNERYGFSLDIPEGFILGSEVENGAGIILTNNALRMTVTAVGYNNEQRLDLDAVAASLWNGSEDSIVRKGNGRVVIYQYDEEYEYFIWAYVGEGSIDQMTIRYPLQDDNRDELDAAQTLMQGFLPGDLSIPH